VVPAEYYFVGLEYLPQAQYAGKEPEDDPGSHVVVRKLAGGVPRLVYYEVAVYEEGSHCCLAFLISMSSIDAFISANIFHCSRV